LESIDSPASASQIFGTTDARLFIWIKKKELCFSRQMRSADFLMFPEYIKMLNKSENEREIYFQTNKQPRKLNGVIK
jgi:hypothetical protein